MRKQKTKIAVIIILVILIIGFFIPVPYYISKPGGTEKLNDLVTVSGKADHKKGSFSLVTVAMAKANPYTYLLAKMMPYYELEKVDDVRYKNETDAEYNVRQLYMMNESKNNAIQAAYHAAKRPLQVNYQGIYVLSVRANTPAAKKIKAGDLITAIDGKAFKSSEAFIKYVKAKKTGATVSLTYKRDKKAAKTVRIKLIALDKKGTPGIGITLVDDKTVKASPKADIDSEKIGGPSAGLMFTLELYSRFSPNDLSKGKQIAGTGTIDPAGNVGRIGGIDQKIVAADKSGASIFFAPNDKITKAVLAVEPGAISNYAEAKKTATAIHSKMKIVPVKTFQDALNYLKHNVK